MVTTLGMVWTRILGSHQKAGLRIYVGLVSVFINCLSVRFRDACGRVLETTWANSMLHIFDSVDELKNIVFSLSRISYFKFLSSQTTSKHLEKRREVWNEVIKKRWKKVMVISTLPFMSTPDFDLHGNGVHKCSNGEGISGRAKGKERKLHSV